MKLYLLFQLTNDWRICHLVGASILPTRTTMSPWGMSSVDSRSNFCSQPLAATHSRKPHPRRSSRLSFLPVKGWIRCLVRIALTGVKCLCTDMLAEAGDWLLSSCSIMTTHQTTMNPRFLCPETLKRTSSCFLPTMFRSLRRRYVYH